VIDLKERSIDEVEGFCGWDFLLRLTETLDSPQYQGFVATSFETGGRVSEVLELTKSHFKLTLHPGLIVVEHMPVFKRFEVVGKTPDPAKKKGFRWVTKRLRDHRIFPIRKDEPLVPYMLNWLKADWPYQSAPGERLFDLDRFDALEMLRYAGKLLHQPIPLTHHKKENRRLWSSEIFPHLLRAERASQLASEYGFDVYGLRQFFGWKARKIDMAEKYASLDWKGLARRMGVQNLG